MNSYFGDDCAAWDWWETVEALGNQILTSSSKFPRERWHLHLIHRASTHNEVSKVLAARLGKLFNRRVLLRLGSVWIDQTPQARTNYWNSSVKKEGQVSCELADLLIVTHINLLGASQAQMDTRAVLVQAKVSGTPGILDSAPMSSKTSSSRERNLLECACRPISLYRSTKSTNPKQLLGKYNLGCKPGNAGLYSFARYLTIADSLSQLPGGPYQSMWPDSRGSNSGKAKSLEDMIFSMMATVGSASGEGASLINPPNSDWRRLVNDLTGTLNGSVVKRFLATGGVNRVEEGAIVCFQGQASQFFPKWTPPGQPYIDMAAVASGGGLGHLDREPPRSVPRQPEPGNGPAISVIVVHAAVVGD